MSSYINNFKNVPFEKRLHESSSMRQKYPDRVPVIVGKMDTDKNLPFIEKHKYLVPNDIVMTQFIYIIRKQMKLSSEQALFVFINDVIYTSKTLITTIYDKHKSEDGFLYAIYAGENTFGK